MYKFHYPFFSIAVWIYANVSLTTSVMDVDSHRMISRIAARVGGVVAVAGASFMLGVRYGNESPFKNLNAATAITTLPTTPSIPPMPIEKIKPTNDIDTKQYQEDYKGISRASEIMRYGFPGFDNLRTFEDFVLSYDQKTKTAHWVCEHLTPTSLTYDPSVDRSKCEFREDPSFHKYFQSENSDYKGSGYDRGHLAAAGNHRKTQNSVNQTFLLSNMSPQVGRGFNRDKWNDLERHARRTARNSLNTYILTGPLYLPYKAEDGNSYVKYKVIGTNSVAVPTHFFKVILAEKSPGNFELESFVLPNQVIPDSTELSAFYVPLEMIERNGGFLIFDKLPKDKLKKINGKKIGGFW
ncbi:DNA/RNA non-specific endonuclease [Dictyocaulus viviparus]|uniref:Endonuclease n=1 Tax=Dictyocaulus viviparus TaxID=29172 RepID=A0A0D8Y552_DICVI|nr:DNA/RNA non-specific endonuclease [Dictyocaulus viviparus]